MSKLRYYLPDHMTHNHEVVIKRITEQLYSAGWKEKLIQKWWQTPMHELNNHCPLEAVCNDKEGLAQMCADKTLRSYEKQVYALQESAKQVKAILKEDDTLYDIKVTEE